jgi:hypothetical protein
VAEIRKAGPRHQPNIARPNDCYLHPEEPFVRLNDQQDRNSPQRPEEAASVRVNACWQRLSDVSHNCQLSFLDVPIR